MTQRMAQQNAPAWNGTQAGDQASRQQPRDHWQEFTMGLVGGAVGVLAMDLGLWHDHSRNDPTVETPWVKWERTGD